MSVEISPDSPVALIAAHSAERPKTAAVAPSVRMAGVEWLRFSACFGIILFHVQAPGLGIGYGGLPALTAVSAAFAVADRGDDKRAVWKRVQRLLFPWLFWCAVYALVNVGRVVHRGGILTWPGSLGWENPLIGPADHLWFLPFIFCMSVMLVWLMSERGMVTDKALGWGGMAGFLALVVPCALVAQHGWAPDPFNQWLMCLPAVCWGMVLTAHGRTKGHHTPLLLLQTLIALAGVGMTAFWLRGSFAVPYTVGLIACAIAWSIKKPVGPVGRWVGGLGYGIYVVHPLVLLVIYKYCALPDHSWQIVGLAFAGSVALTALLKASPLRRFV